MASGAADNLIEDLRWLKSPVLVGARPRVEDAEVAGGCVDAHAEEVGDAAGVAAGGLDLLDDAVVAEGLGGDPGFVPGELVSGRAEAACGEQADEQVSRAV